MNKEEIKRELDKHTGERIVIEYSSMEPMVIDRYDSVDDRPSGKLRIMSGSETYAQRYHRAFRPEDVISITAEGKQKMKRGVKEK